MAQTMVQIRVDKDLKDRVADVYEAIGIDIPTAIRMFFKQSLSVGGLPFDCRIAQSKPWSNTGKILSERLREKRSDMGIACSKSMDDGATAFAAMRKHASRKNEEWSLDEINEEISKSRVERKFGKAASI